jgi:hypothetical protein
VAEKIWKEAFVSAVPESAVYFNLEEAALCVDCEAVFTISRNRCPRCDSGSSLPIAKVLDAESNRELVEGLRALSMLMSWAKRPKPLERFQALAEAAQVEVSVLARHYFPNVPPARSA